MSGDILFLLRPNQRRFCSPLAWWFVLGLLLSVSICWFGFNLGCGLVGGYGSANTSFVLLLVLCSVVVVFSFFLALFVCFFGFWFPGLFSDLLRFAGINSFNFASAALEKLGRLTTLARNGLVLVAAVASCWWLSLFPC
ncbi:hypothetical protein QL285_080678 [Trifolium repens]|nr:hypothetical protein QL285_080678 [Trifolium repens]